MAEQRKTPNIIEILIVVVILGLLAALAGNASLLEAIAVLFAGWLEWLPRLGQLTLRHPLISGGLAAATAVLGVGLHLFGRWLWRRGAGQGRWRVLWSLYLLGIAFCLGGAGIAAIGLVHESGWLYRMETFSANLDRKKALSARAERGLKEAESQALRVQRHYGREGRFPESYRKNLEGEGTLSYSTVDEEGVVTVAFEPGFFIAPFAHPGEERLNALKQAGSLELRPRPDAAGVLHWRCSAAFASGFGPLNFLPDGCVLEGYRR